MTEAKPILLIQINTPRPTTSEIWSGNSSKVTFQENMEQRFNDYHVLCFNGYNEFNPSRQLQIELKVFNHVNISDVNFEELKEIIKGELDAPNRDR